MSQSLDHWQHKIVVYIIRSKWISQTAQISECSEWFVIRLCRKSRLYGQRRASDGGVSSWLEMERSSFARRSVYFRPRQACFPQATGSSGVWKSLSTNPFSYSARLCYLFGYDFLSEILRAVLQWNMYETCLVTWQQLHTQQLDAQNPMRYLAISGWAISPAGMPGIL
jgi:hypothetical protein